MCAPSTAPRWTWTAPIRNARVPEELARKIRASYYLIGALLGRFGSAEVPPSGWL